ncbi:MAG TPA: helix-turn-helix domain-containing protein [Acidimicrobiia bacterium]
MPSFRPSQAAELLGVSPDTVRRWADEGRLKTTKTEGGHRQIDGKDLARFLSEHVKPSEPDLMVQSARNRFVGLVTRIERDKLTAIVEVQAGPHRVVSLITREGADDLGVDVGDLAVAVVKATNVIIEVPPFG